MKRLLLIVSATAMLSVCANAQEFVKINPDARISAMGNTGISASGDAYPTFNNPASPLFEYHSIQASFGYTLFAGEEYSKYRLMAIGGYLRLHERHSISIGGKLLSEPRLTAGRRPDTKMLDAAYGYKIGDCVALAATVRYLHHNNGDGGKCNAMGFDVGVLSKIPVAIFDGSSVGIGAKLSNVGFGWGEEYDAALPLSAAVGTSLYLPVRDTHSLEVALDFNYCFAPKPLSRFTTAIGVEYTLMQLIRFRCGGNFANHLCVGSIGAGIRLLHLQFDIAYSIAGRHNPMRNTLQFSAGVDF